MEQLASRPASLSIPKPIEQQFAAYQLGTLLEVYKLGWVKDRRISKFPLLLIILGAIVVGIVSIMGFVTAVQTTNTLPNILLVIPFFAFMIAGVSIPLLFQASLCVGAFSEGLMYAKKTHVTVLYWAEIESCEQKMIKNLYYGIIRSYKIHSRDNRTLKLKVPSSLRVDNLDKVIREHIAAL